MATIKHYTDLEQSKKLAEILPLESADMHYSKDFDGKWFVNLAEYTSVKIPKYVDKVEEHLLPCWSLAGLLDFLKDKIIFGGNSPKEGWFCCYTIKNPTKLLTICEDSLVNTCVEMILKLHKLNML